LLAATFHPELSSDRRVHRFFVDMVREQRDRNEAFTGLK
jgi:5'-phosphate synthase pdxT subunit